MQHAHGCWQNTTAGMRQWMVRQAVMHASIKAKHLNIIVSFVPWSLSIRHVHAVAHHSLRYHNVTTCNKQYCHSTRCIMCELTIAWSSSSPSMLTTASQPAAEPTASRACAPPAQAQQDSAVSGVVSTCKAVTAHHTLGRQQPAANHQPRMRNASTA
jgi:hypothetical protein